jgi:hypothetical protein
MAKVRTVSNRWKPVSARNRRRAKRNEISEVKLPSNIGFYILLFFLLSTLAIIFI